MSLNWILSLVVVAIVTTNGVAMGQFGGFYGRGGIGGYYGPGPFGSVYGGYGGFGPLNGGYPGYGYGNPGYGFGSYGFGNGLGNYGYGNSFYFAQPIYSSYNQPLYSNFNQPLYSNRLISQPLDVTPVYSRPSIYRQPSSTSTLYSGSSPVVTTPRVVLAQQQQAIYDGGEIVLFSPPTNTSEVQYSLNGAPYTMKPGSLQKFANDRTWRIEVKGNTSQGSRYTLSTGRYKFRQSGTAIDLFSTKDNPEAPAPLPVPEAVTLPSLDTVVPAPAPMPDE